jgi:glycerophosphoryl diester phosphodiesterase
MPVRFRDLMQTGRVMAFAHRGAGLVAPENTLAAFRAAVEMGFQALETDVQLSRDGVLFIHHDTSLKRLTGEDRKLEDLTAADLDSLTIAGAHAIPRLADLVEDCPDAVFNLDAKTWNAVKPMAAFIREGGLDDRVCIGAFSDARIRGVMDGIDPATCHSIGTRNSIRFFLGYVTGLPLHFAADCVQLPVSWYGAPLVTARSVSYAHARGLKVHVWTVNDRAEMHRLIDLGVDGLMSDDCALLKEVLIERGHWTDA